MKKQLHSTSGISMVELMIATLLIGLVFAVAMSIYSSSYRFMNIQSSSSSDPTQNPVVALEDISKRISLCNDAVVPNAQTLHLRCDYQPNSYNALNTPANFGDDAYWHYQFTGTNLLMSSDNAAASLPALPGATLVIPNVNVGTSTFTLTPASGAGNATKIDIVVNTTASGITPATQVRTSAFLGAKATR